MTKKLPSCSLTSDFAPFPSVGTLTLTMKNDELGELSSLVMYLGKMDVCGRAVIWNLKKSNEDLMVLLLSGRIAAETEPAEPEDDGVEGRKAGGEGWSVWSSWSPCSRSCNGGVTYSLRKCEHNGACEGDSTKYRICNMQACPDPTQDFRAAQCSAYNPVPYNNRLYEWLPYQDPEDPCGLTCHARGHSFVAKLAPSVRDGTRCRDGSLDMCVDGECMAVGCDLQLGSEKRVDECGVCGGDGSSCRRPLYVWSRTPFSPCSVSCGGEGASYAHRNHSPPGGAAE
ncbi:ADAMTS-like protein 3 [Uloborus diversus]|uniref:ADAMTS-like protein 3 n=1 Tax=Uloborus diversus TaxID=327109 RepID=UPI0024090F73|nr:ADAMTS-like protein 3 [Uloborus diversus]